MTFLLKFNHDQAQSAFPGETAGLRELEREKELMESSPSAYVIASAAVAEGIEHRLKSEGTIGIMESTRFEDWRNLLQKVYDGERMIGNPDFDRQARHAAEVIRELHEPGVDHPGDALMQVMAQRATSYETIAKLKSRSRRPYQQQPEPQN